MGRSQAMPLVSPISPSRARPPAASNVLVGTGFLALDLLYRNAARKASRAYAGGSFGNVMAILSFLGWKSYPVARIGTGDNARQVLDDLKEFHVRTEFVRRAVKGATPVIVVRVVQSADGAFRSRFEWRHPRSGERLPSYRPLPKFLAEEISPALPKAKVFYFDRAEASSLLLASEMRKRGALVFFEPSSCRDERIFSACMGVSDVVKYSAQRVPATPQNPDNPSPRLEIQTLGEGGLRFRLKHESNRPGTWQCLASFPVEDFKDATGCGDWCSAGFLYHVGRLGRASFLTLDVQQITAGLQFGQALSALNCSFVGARGPMYSLSPDEVLRRADLILKAKSD